MSCSADAVKPSHNHKKRGSSLKVTEIHHPPKPSAPHAPTLSHNPHEKPRMNRNAYKQEAVAVIRLMVLAVLDGGEATDAGTEAHHRWLHFTEGRGGTNSQVCKHRKGEHLCISGSSPRLS